MLELQPEGVKKWKGFRNMFLRNSLYTGQTGRTSSGETDSQQSWKCLGFKSLFWQHINVFSFVCLWLGTKHPLAQKNPIYIQETGSNSQCIAYTDDISMRIAQSTFNISGWFSSARHGRFKIENDSRLLACLNRCKVDCAQYASANLTLPVHKCCTWNATKEHTAQNVKSSS